MAVHVFGIRHHGPGSARSLAKSLAELGPDIVLIEGPPEANAILPLVIHEQMKPPVAILIHAPDEPSRAVYYPFAVYSPEWQAIVYAVKRDIPVRFMDLPPSHQLAIEKARELEAQAPDSDDNLADASTAREDISRDPLYYIARAAGYDDGERWWEHMVEERRDGEALFQGINEAMTALREELGDQPGNTQAHGLERERLREAHMRRTIRGAQKEGFENIAVVCGAWHAPALRDMPPVKADNALLKGLPKTKVAATWVPWTYGRLALASGYGAGVTAPGWYHHLWTAPNRVSIRWLTQAARLLREEGIDVSSAHVIEAVRLGETLAALRGRPLPGLDEMNEAAQTVMLFGEALPLRLIERTLIIGERLGRVPDDAPQTPLQRDLTREQTRLRLKPTAEDKALVLDLRKPVDLERSYLLRRLAILGIAWGSGGERAAGKGTFKESWRIQWQPEFAVKLIEAGVHGNTVAHAATTYAMTVAHETVKLPALTSLARAVMLADLPAAVEPVMHRLEAVAAVASDVTHLMDALPALARLLRYGDVRHTDTAMVEHIVDGLMARICVGLPPAASSLNEAVAEAMFGHLMAVHDALGLLDNRVYREDWHATLLQLAGQDGLQGLLQGRCCRLLLDAGALVDAEVARRFSLALSPGNDPDQAAGWIDGFLRDSGQVLIYDETLWNLIDRWVSDLPANTLTPLLPLLRRTFSTFTAPERRQLGERVARGPQAAPAVTTTEADFDRERAEAVLPLVAQLLGLEDAS